MLVTACAAPAALPRASAGPAALALALLLALSGLSVIAVVGPLIGGLATWVGDWRAAPAIVTATGALTLVFIALRLPETRVTVNPRAMRLRPLLQAMRGIGRHRAFVAWTALISCTDGGLFTILAGSSFVYIEVLGRSPRACMLGMALGSAIYLAGTFVCRRWRVRLGTAGAVRRGAFFTLAGGVLMLVPIGLEAHHAGAMLLAQCLFAFGHGVHQPCGQAGAVGPFPQTAGAALALSGSVLAGTAFMVDLWLRRALDGGLVPYAVTAASWSAMTALVAWSLVQRIDTRSEPT